jgi:hypothetical protein
MTEMQNIPIQNIPIQNTPIYEALTNAFAAEGVECR